MIVAVSAFIDFGQSSFFRGRVKEVFEGQASVKVQLVDIGLELKVQWTSLRAIHEQFTAVQIQVKEILRLIRVNSIESLANLIPVR